MYPASHHWKKNGLVLGILAATLATASLANADTISWRWLGQPSSPRAISVGYRYSARKIAVCDDGRLYRVDVDRTVWVKSLGGADNGWRFITGLPYDAVSISCAMNQLYAFNGETLERNDGKGDHVEWTRVGRFKGALQVVAVTTPAGAAFYALAGGGRAYLGLMWSPSGADGSWRTVGDSPNAYRISAASESEIFLLTRNRAYPNEDLYKNLYINHGFGLQPYWLDLTTPEPKQGPSAIVEMASAGPGKLYALDNLHRLWEGTVTRTARSVTIEPSDLDFIINHLVLPGMDIRLDRDTGSLTPSPFLEGLGATPQTFSIPILSFHGISIYLNDVNLSDIYVTLGQDRISLSVSFEENGAELIVDSPLIPNFDINNFNVTADLVPRMDAWGDRVLVLENFRFNGVLRPRGVYLGAYRDYTVARYIEGQLAPVLAGLFSSPQARAGVRQVLLALAAYQTRETWQHVTYGTVEFQERRLHFIVER